MFIVAKPSGAEVDLGVLDRLEALRLFVQVNATGAMLKAGDVMLTKEAALIELGLGRPGLFAPYSKEWVSPAQDEIRELLRIARLSSSEAGQLVGVSSGKVRKWAGKIDDIPYAVWRLLCIYARLATPETMPFPDELAK